MKKVLSLITAIALLTLALPVAALALEMPVRQALLNAYENDSFLSGMDFEKIGDLYRYEVYESLNDAVLAISAEKSDYANLPAISVDYILARSDALEASESSGEMFYFMATAPGNTALQGELSSGIAKVRENGTLDALIEKYLYVTESDPETTGETSAKADAVEVIRVGVTGDVPPMDYIDAAGNPAGFNVALLDAIAKELGVRFELVSLTAGARLVALTTGKIDVLFYAVGHGDNAQGYQDDRVLLTESYYACGMKRLCRKGDLLAVNEAMQNVATIYAQRMAE